VGFCLDILPVNILYISQSNPLYYSSLSFFPNLYYLTVFSVFCFVLFLYRCDALQYYSLPFIPFFFSFPIVSSNSPTFGNTFSIHAHVSTYVFIKMLVFVFGSIFQIWEKIYSPCLYEPGKFWFSFLCSYSSLSTCIIQVCVNAVHYKPMK
jgi:hypothetical protein